MGEPATQTLLKKEASHLPTKTFQSCLAIHYKLLGLFFLPISTLYLSLKQKATWGFPSQKLKTYFQPHVAQVVVVKQHLPNLEATFVISL